MKSIAKSAVKKSFDLIGLELRRKRPQKEQWELEEGSLVVPKIWNRRLFQKMIPLRLQSSTGSILLLGSSKEIEFLQPGFVAGGREVRGFNWDWESQTDKASIPTEGQDHDLVFPTTIGTPYTISSLTNKWFKPALDKANKITAGQFLTRRLVGSRSVRRSLHR